MVYKFKRYLVRMRQKTRQLGGKIRRYITCKVNSDYVSSQLRKRRGKCLRCGRCCRLVFKCPFLKTTKDGKTRCTIYTHRSVQCKMFPIDKKDLKEVNFLCGYWFEE